MNVRRECVRCEADTRQNIQCKRRTCMRKGYCYQHLRKEKQLNVKKSAVAGLGLFTVDAKKTSDKIANYTGQVISSDTARSRYAVQWSRGRVLDSNSTQDAVGRYANVCRQANIRRGQCRGNNAKIVRNYQRGKAALRATKRIPAGGEVFAAYGQGYRV